MQTHSVVDADDVVRNVSDGVCVLSAVLLPNPCYHCTRSFSTTLSWYTSGRKKCVVISTAWPLSSRVIRLRTSRNELCDISSEALISEEG